VRHHLLEPGSHLDVDVLGGHVVDALGRSSPPR
jgi:hypothetical protein